jgi:hypothetical protein
MVRDCSGVLGHTRRREPTASAGRSCHNSSGNEKGRAHRPALLRGVVHRQRDAAVPGQYLRHLRMKPARGQRGDELPPHGVEVEVPALPVLVRDAGCPARWCAPGGAWCTGCCNGTRGSMSCAGPWRDCGGCDSAEAGHRSRGADASIRRGAKPEKGRQPWGTESGVPSRHHAGGDAEGRSPRATAGMLLGPGGHACFGARYCLTYGFWVQYH